jgi:hypothetical protein
MALSLRAAMRYAISILVLASISSCGDSEPTSAFVIEDPNPTTIDGECYKQAFQYDIAEGKKAYEEFIAATENNKFNEYLATSNVREAQADLDICTRYAQCYDHSENERHVTITRCTEQRIQQRLEDMGY